MISILFCSDTNKITCKNKYMSLASKRTSNQTNIHCARKRAAQQLLYDVEFVGIDIMCSKLQ